MLQQKSRTILHILVSYQIRLPRSSGMFGTTFFNKSSPTPSSDYYVFPSVLQSFVNKDTHFNTSSTSDSVPLITDSDGNSSQPPSTSSPFSRRFSMFSAPSDNEPESFRGLSRGQRLLYFGISVFCTSLFFSFALIFIPLLATPSGLRKFVFMYVLSNVALMFAFAFAFGPWTYAKSLVTRDRLPSTLAYGGSLFLGIYGVVWWRSTFCALLAIVIQIGLGLWQLKQFIWGGAKAFSLFSIFSSLRPGRISGTNLPV
ncbi:Protein transport protein SFT2 [Echinococcus granulosus]|nr:Protein transport protein SFT2 [Echinococcus granulosus]